MKDSFVAAWNAMNKQKDAVKTSFSSYISTLDQLKSVNGITYSIDKLKMLRHYMLIPWPIRSMVTMLVVCFLSLLQGADEIHHIDGLTSRQSTLNQVFVKMGWAWTLCAASALTLSLLPVCYDRVKMGGRALARLSALTVVFYFWCAMVFPAIEHWTGVCVSKNVVLSHYNKQQCVKIGHSFYSFDISGHTFLMIYCVLTLMQEAQVMRRYISLGEAITKLEQSNAKEEGSCSCYKEPLVEQQSSDELSDDSTSKTVDTMADNSGAGSSNTHADTAEDGNGGHSSSVTISEREAIKFRSTFLFLWPLICFCYVCIFLLCITWDVVLIITTVYYHTLLEKFLGSIIAAGSFALLYGGLFVKLQVT